MTAANFTRWLEAGERIMSMPSPDFEIEIRNWLAYWWAEEEQGDGPASNPVPA